MFPDFTFLSVWAFLRPVTCFFPRRWIEFVGNRLGGLLVDVLLLPLLHHTDAQRNTTPGENQ